MTGIELNAPWGMQLARRFDTLPPFYIDAALAKRNDRYKKMRIVLATCVDYMLAPVYVCHMAIRGYLTGVHTVHLKETYGVGEALYFLGYMAQNEGLYRRLVMFALGRMPGWIAHWREMHMSGTEKIYRPRQIYTGPLERLNSRSV